ncbi:MAG: hypothetical protein LUQ50_15250, partial [Methanospirillum sp.]|uniref:hypothetical protein n=1 Tax=Methanospirillum sp. TaxID=45200 RepID=UPI00236DFA73
NKNGDLQFGRDLTGAKQITFQAKGENGSEIISAFVGQTNNSEYIDTPDWNTNHNFTLTNKWEKYTIPLQGQNLTSVIRGFGLRLFPDKNPNGATIYLDDIQYEW